MGQLHIEIINDGTSQDGEKLGTLGDIQYVIEQKNITRELLIFA
jgi:sporulation protein YlmC with PRC-barrel domain